MIEEEWLAVYLLPMLAVYLSPKLAVALLPNLAVVLSMLITCLLVNLPTRQLPLIIIDVNYGLSLQVTRLSSTCQLVNYHL